MFDAVQKNRDGSLAQNDFENLSQTQIVANHHILFGKTKASSSGEVKPPSADDLLNFYTADQLRAHWLALGLSQKSVGFSPKPFEPDEAKRNDPRVADPVLKEGTLLTNVFNRLARSCFYEAQNNFDGEIPMLKPTQKVIDMVLDTIQNYEKLMEKVELYSVMQLMDKFIRDAQFHWADGIKKVSNKELQDGIDVRQGAAPSEARKQILADSFYLLCACTLLMHPVVPLSCEKICEYMNFSKQEFFNWDNFAKILDTKFDGQTQKLKELPPRFDFFKKHPSQFK